jgi:hypothetical protein
MSSKPTARFTINTAELKLRIDLATKVYNNSVRLSPLDDGSAATLTFQYSNVTDAFIPFADMLAAGWSIPEKMESNFVTVMGQAYGIALGNYTELHLVKPLKVREAELKVIAEATKVQYQSELDAQREAEVERVTNQQIEATRRKAIAEQHAKEVAERQAVRDEVSAALAGGK